MPETLADYMARPAEMVPSPRDLEFIEENLAAQGLPGFDLEDRETYTVTLALWRHAYLGVDAVADQSFTSLAVARRVMGAWESLYIPADDVTEADLAVVSPAPRTRVFQKDEGTTRGGEIIGPVWVVPGCVCRGLHLQGGNCPATEVFPLSGWTAGDVAERFASDEYGVTVEVV